MRIPIIARSNATYCIYSFNKLQNLDKDAFYGLDRNLTTLNLSNNHITSLGKLMKTLYKLEVLILDYNPIDTIVPSSLPYSLQEFSLLHGYVAFKYNTRIRL